MYEMKFRSHICIIALLCSNSTLTFTINHEATIFTFLALSILSLQFAVVARYYLWELSKHAVDSWVIIMASHKFLTGYRL